MVKIVCLFIILTLYTCFVSNAQLLIQKRVTLQIKNGTVIEALNEISKQTGIGYVNSSHLLDETNTINISLSNATLKDALVIISKNQYIILTLVGDEIKPQQKFINVFGIIQNDQDEAIKGVTITAEGSKTATSNIRGEFSLEHVFANAMIRISADKIYSDSFKLNGQTNLEVTVKEKVRPLKQIVVTACTGYQYVHKKRSPSSFFVVTNNSLQQQSGNTISARMKGIALGVLETVNKVEGVNQPKINSITTRSTLFADPNPLIVVDNFPYTGDINQINPDDIMTINILKDATATSQWGTRAGNGVIVITTKSGKYNQPLEVTLNTSLTLGEVPDLSYNPLMRAQDKIEFMKELFNRNFYKPFESPKVHLSIPTVVEYLILHRDSLISFATLTSRLNQLSRDIRTDVQKYFYRKSLENHVSAQLSGGKIDNAYYLSTGYDYNHPNVRDSWTTRKSIFFNHNFILKDKLEIITSLSYLENESHNTGDLPEVREPLVDSNGNPVAQPLKWRQQYIDTAGGGKLLNWHFVPLKDFELRNRTIKDENLRLHTSLKLRLTKGLDFNLLYQYQRDQTEMKLLNNRDSYLVRDLVNSYTQRTVNGFEKVIPYSNVLDFVNSSTRVNSFRPQFIFAKTWFNQHDLKIQAGAEQIRIREDVDPGKIYGYVEDSLNLQNDLDFKTHFGQYANEKDSIRIPGAARSYTTFTKYVSYFTIFNYTYNSKINLSASARMDKTILKPKVASDQFIKSFSTGIGWNISSEPFYKFRWFPYLKIRMTYGTNGNPPVSNILTPINQTAGSIFNNIDQHSVKPVWESVRTFNVGVDVCTKNNLIEASIDAYQKSGKDLIAFRPIDKDHHDSLVIDNIASMKGYGIDFVFYSKNINKNFRWSTKLLASYVNDHVDKYDTTNLAAWIYCEQGYQSVAPGRPLYGIFSFRSAGLESTTGDPVGYFNNQKSKLYDSILIGPGYKQLRFHGRSTPSLYGSMINEFSIGPLSVSVILTYKFGYYFRKASINYFDLANGFSNGHPDYQLRWQKSGDELKTTVPSMPKSLNQYRDLFYGYSENLVERGDHIRLQAINTRMDFKPKWLNRYHINTFTFFANLNNIGIIWRANNKKLDPDKLNPNEFPDPKSLYIGCKLTFK